MFIRTEFITEKKFVGDSLTMSLEKDRTYELWSRFRPKVNLIENRINQNFISLQIYPSLDYFKAFDFSNLFKKFALVEVKDLSSNEFKQVIIKDTLYAVFLHKGSSKEFPLTMNYILSDWLPNSQFKLADAPHFEILGDKYNRESPNSEEEVWIPIERILD